MFFLSGHVTHSKQVFNHKSFLHSRFLYINIWRIGKAFDLDEHRIDDN